MVFPGLAYAYYEGDYWPKRIEHRRDESLYDLWKMHYIFFRLDHDIRITMCWQIQYLIVIMPRPWQMLPMEIGMLF